MALTSPALILAVEAMFGNIKPTLNALKKLGVTDFSAENPAVEIKPGATIKVPVSSVSAASEYNASTNHYRTGGDTDWATLTAKHYLQGFDITGVNVDQGVDASRMKQLFTARAGTGIAMAIQNVVKTSIDGIKTSTSASGKIAPVASITMEGYMGIGDGLDWLDKASSTLVVNGPELASIRAKFAANHIVAGSLEELAGYMGFKDIVVIPGMTARAAIVPSNAMGFLARVPTIIAKYLEIGTETDPDTGLSIGIVIADDQDHNRLIANADLWFGCTVQGAPEAATKAGIVKLGTAA